MAWLTSRRWRTSEFVKGDNDRSRGVATNICLATLGWARGNAIVPGVELSARCDTIATPIPDATSAWATSCDSVSHWI